MADSKKDGRARRTLDLHLNEAALLTNKPPQYPNFEPRVFKEVN